MQIKPLRLDLEMKVKKLGLSGKFAKARSFFENDPRHPSLHTELLGPKQLKIYSFRIDRKYRAQFIIVNGVAEITEISLHFQ